MGRKVEPRAQVERASAVTFLLHAPKGDIEIPGESSVPIGVATKHVDSAEEVIEDLSEHI